MDAGTIVLVVTAALGSPILLKLFEAIIEWGKGRAKREVSAWEDRDRQARRARKAEDHRHRLVMLAREYGVPEEKLQEIVDS